MDSWLSVFVTVMTLIRPARLSNAWSSRTRVLIVPHIIEILRNDAGPLEMDGGEQLIMAPWQRTDDSLAMKGRALARGGSRRYRRESMSA